MDDLEQIDWLYDRITPYLARNKKQKNKIIFRCPFCGDSKKNKSKMRGEYHIDSASYWCWNCEKSATGFELLAQISGDDHDDILQEFFKLKYNGKYSNSKAVKRELSVSERIQIIEPLDTWTYDIPQRIIDYLNKRLIFDAPYLSSDYRFMYDTEHGGLVIPWLNSNDQMIYYQTRNMSGDGLKYVFPSDTFKPVGGMDGIDLAFPYIIACEGFFDSKFIHNGVCVGGRVMTKYQRMILKERYPHHTIVQFYDNDGEGRKSMVKYATKSPRDQFLMYPSNMVDGEDINDYALKHGVDNVFSRPKELEKLITHGVMIKMQLSKMYK
jgi:transcription elongation factor Elf1